MSSDLQDALPGGDPRPQPAAAELPRARGRAEGRRLQPAVRRPPHRVPARSRTASSRTSSFQGSGCAISKASASLMTESVKGKTVDRSDALFERFQQMITAHAQDSPIDELGKLTALGRRPSVSDARRSARAWRGTRCARRPRRDTTRWCRPNEAASRHSATPAARRAGVSPVSRRLPA